MATPLDFAKALLNRLGLPWTENRLVSLVAFAAAEGGHFVNPVTRFNPMNTSRDMPGAVSVIGGVKAYPDWETGIEATARTMAQTAPGFDMSPILDALVADADPKTFQHAVTSTPWCPQSDPQCSDYAAADPYVLYNSYKDRSDTTELAVGPPAIAIPSGLRLAVSAGAILLLAGGIAWYLTPGSRLKRALGAAENPRRRRRYRGGQVQTLVFPRTKFTPSTAKSWARARGFRYGKVDVTDKSIRIRQRSPAGFRRMRTIPLGPDVKAVVGFTAPRR